MQGNPAFLPKLDARLQAIANQVPSCLLAADIGADHGKLSHYLLASDRVARMIVSDLSPGSRKKMRELFAAQGLLERVQLSGADGLFALQGRPEAVIIAGMGGGLVADILTQPVDLQGSMLVLSAQTELPLVREALQKRGYAIMQELLVKAAGRYYRVMTAKPGSQQLNPTQMALGVNLQGTASASLQDYYRWQLQVAESWQGEKGSEYRRMLKEALDDDSTTHS